ncbi:MAG: sensor histidine kinase [Gemmatimonadales bacterium]
MNPRPGLADRPGRILVVDDERQNRALLEVMLAPEGFDVQTAASGEDALALVAQQPPDLILLDIMMPGMDGYEVARRVKGAPSTRNIPIIMVTAHGDRAARMRGLGAGAEDFLSKPVDRAELSVRVKNLLRLKAYGDYYSKYSESLESQLRQSQKMEALGQLAGGVAHDFNNLLTVIMSYADLVMRDLCPGGTSHDDLVQVVVAATSAAALTRQLLAFSRNQVLQPTAVDVNELVGGTEKMLARLIDDTVDLVTVLAPTPAIVCADRGQLEQVLMNLVVNARDAMPKGGRLTITTEEVDVDGLAVNDVAAGSYVAVAVSDTGTGMDNATKERLFEPFFTTKGPGKGTGLGLATVYGIVQQSGGFIRVESVLGSGTTFRVHLPRVYDPLTTPASAAPTIASASATIRSSATRPPKVSA